MDEESPLLEGTNTRNASRCNLSEGKTYSSLSPREKATVKKLAFAASLALLFMGLETIGGIMAGSLAIITDAAHLLADVSGFIVSLFAIYYASKESGKPFSYGYHRMEVLGALASVLTIWLVTGILLFEAVGRILKPEPINGKIMTILAIIGIVINIILIFVLGGHSHGHSHSHSHAHDKESDSHSSHADDHHDGANLNLRGAVIHVIGDFIQSIGVAIAGGLIWWHQGDPKWFIIDPLCTILFALIVLWTTSGIVRDISDVLMERTPRQIDIGSMHAQFESVQGVHSLHDLHVWSLTPGIPLLAAHVEICEDVDPNQALHGLSKIAESNGISHTTFQLVQMNSSLACPCLE
eukprot:jgi/Picsp_1/2934/NSC_01159-R1_zinc transporter